MRASWLTCPQPRHDAALRLFCLPHAGSGAAVFHPLASLLPDSIEMIAVQLPGRETRLAEPPFTQMHALVDALLLGIRENLQIPFAFFGHSMGALVAFELSRALRRQALPLPSTIVVSGRRSPTVPNSEPPLHRLPDAAFVEALVQRYDAIPQVVRNEPELMALFVPTLKADFATFETHQHYEEAPLDCALALYGGQDDPQTHQMNGWTSLCSGPRKARIFPGGHFYFLNQRPALAEALAEDVLASVPAE